MIIQRSPDQGYQPLDPSVRGEGEAAVATICVDRHAYCPVKMGNASDAERRGRVANTGCVVVLHSCPSFLSKHWAGSCSVSLVTSFLNDPILAL
jgi:hypothetical protein